MFVERQHVTRHRRSVRVDQQPIAGGVDRFVVTGKVNFADELDRKTIDIGGGIEPMVHRRDHHIIHVEQKATARSLSDRRQKIHLVDRTVGEQYVGRRIFQQQLSAERLLRFIDMVDDAQQRFFRVGQRQQIVEKSRVMRRPGQVFGKAPRPIAVEQAAKPFQMRLVEPARRPDRQAYTVQRKRIVFRDGLEIAMRRPTCAHIVLGVHLEEADIRQIGQNSLVMLGLEAQACPRRQEDGLVC